MKARHSTKKRRGRPPQLVELREPNGRRSRNKPATDVFDAINKATAREARMRVYGAPEAQCERQEWGYLLGRLYLTTSYGMKSHQHEAGVRMAQDYARYFGLCGFPMPTVRAMDLFRVHGMSGDTDPDANEKAWEKVTDLRAKIIDGAGRVQLMIAERVCVYEQDEGLWGGLNLTLLKSALDVAAKFYGIPIEKDKEIVASKA